jgi:hypothetical protein
MGRAFQIVGVLFPQAVGMEEASVLGRDKIEKAAHTKGSLLSGIGSFNGVPKFSECLSHLSY